MHWGTIAMRGLWPAAFLMTGATTLALLARTLDDVGGSGTFKTVADWIFLAGWTVAAGWSVLFVLRLKRWEAGKGPYCRSCAGPTGFMRRGQVVFGRQLADYRRCYNCGKHTPELT